MHSVLDTVQQISTSLTQPTIAQKTPEDLVFEETSQYIDGLESRLQTVYESTHKLIKRNKDIAQGLKEFSIAFRALAQSEAGSLSNGLTQMYSTVDTLSLLSLEQAEQQVLSFEEPIQDYIRIVGSVKAAINKRYEAKLVYDSACAELLFKQGQTRQDMAQEIDKAKEKLESTKKQCELVSSRVRREIHRFKEAKRVDFKTIVNDFVQANIAYAQQVEAAWQALIPQLQAVQANRRE